MRHAHAVRCPERLEQPFERLDVVVQALVELVPQHLSQRYEDGTAVKDERGEEHEGGPRRELPPKRQRKTA